jgi:YVTN family beta-propeller protein
VNASTTTDAFEGAEVVAGDDDQRSQAPSSSSPIAVAPDDRSVWCVNHDTDTVTQFEITESGLRKVREIRVGDEPSQLAIAPDGKHVFVSNTASGTVSVIRARRSGGRVVDTIRVGTEPYGMAFTPNGSKLYVACARSNDVYVIDPAEREVLEVIDGVGLEPRGVAVTNDGDRRDRDEKVYVTQFFGVDRPGVLIGRDDYKEGRVTIISVDDDEVEGEVVLNPIADTGFRSNGSALDRIPAANPPAFTFTTGAFPNQLNSIAIKGTRAYVPSTGASPNGPVRFNVNVQGLLSVIDLATDTEDVAQTINLNRGINFEPPSETKVFFPALWAIAFEHHSDRGWIASLSSNLIVRVDLDAQGAPTIHAPLQAGDPGAVVRIFVGQSPTGIAIDAHDRRAYVLNEISRDVSVVDLDAQAVVATVQSADLPPAGSEAARLLIGKALFYSSTGVDLPELGPLGVTPARLSNEGWSSCFACHPFGLTDGVTWIFASGPRRSLPLNGSFNPRDPNDAKVLNHSAIFDEIQDFELNIRNVSGGLGLITQADGVTPDPVVAAFNPANAGRSERYDLMTEWVAKRIRTPISPLDDDEDDVEKGRRLFQRANCTACHGGGGWASGRRNFTPPPDAGQISNGQLLAFLHRVGTFDPTAANEVRANGAPALGADGFNPPSLLGAHGMGPYLHNGSALSLAEVMKSVEHRSAGTGGVDKLSKRRDRERLVAFLNSIDADTRPFDLTPLQSAAAAKAEMDAEEELETASEALAIRAVGGNPVRAGAGIEFDLPRDARVTVAVYDVRGRHVVTLAEGARGAGRHVAIWSGRDAASRPVASGIYFARVVTEYGMRTQKLVFTR